MRPAIVFSLSLGVCLFSSPAFAQRSQTDTKHSTKEETVVIKRDNPRTVIEIKDGSVFVNGDEIVTVHDAEAGKVHKKIIIENSTATAGNKSESVEFPSFDMGNENESGNSAPKRAMLGVLTDARDTKGGALVKDISPNSPAATAGLQAGDRIMRIDGKTITDAAMLSMEVGAQHNAGDKVEVQYERDGKTKTASVTLAAAPSDQHQPAMRSFHFGPGDMQQGNNTPNSFFREFSFPGMSNDIGDNARPKIGVSVEDRADGAGVTVLNVSPASAASKAGIREGDVIMSVGEEKVSSVIALQEKIGANKPGERLSITCQRNGKEFQADLILPRSMSKRDL